MGFEDDFPMFDPNDFGISPEMDGVWVTKDGNAIKIEDMKTSHIENCIRLLEKQDYTDYGAWVDRFKLELRIRRIEKFLLL